MTNIKLNKAKLNNGFLIIDSSVSPNNQSYNPRNNTMNANNVLNSPVPSLYDLTDPVQLAQSNNDSLTFKNHSQRNLSSNLRSKSCLSTLKNEETRFLDPNVNYQKRYSSIKSNINNINTNGNLKSKAEECCLYEIMYNSINKLNKYNHVEETEKNIIEEWKQVAASLDKLLFWIFLIITILFSFLSLVFVPWYQNYQLVI